MIDSMTLSAYMTPKTAAKVLSVGRSSVYRWIADGTLPSVRIAGAVRIPTDQLEKRLAEMPAATDAVTEMFQRLVDFEVRRGDDRSSLCPRCAAHPISAKSPFGWCVGCTNDRQTEESVAHEREKARQRAWWDANGKTWREQRRKAASGAST
jgi:excisionase family DNA binding protein